MKWNQVIYADCMNEENGLPTLEDKSIDLGITDFPYNIKKCTGRNSDLSKKILYDDNLPDEEYFKFCFGVYEELKRICNIVAFTPGYKNFRQWIRKYEELQFAAWFDKSKQGGCKIASFNKIDPILIYNLEIERKQHARLTWNVFDLYLICNQFNYGDFIHPCPKPIKLWLKIIKEINPQSVIDPLMGSGTTAEACTKLGIPWIGYEIKKEYSHDINLRLKNCKPIIKYKQKELVI